ncbi:MAG: flagellar filament capping protein FliD [Proteobacteria bacterium]|nr:flagellar filament capping protein FliD [Pseudomonadota bacterium]MDA0851514.1 flagellar filament capping protein FliD [Pseudomonadota bacterium]MDA1296228.1 flagellar filament capping protein FliD [Pseudomonadota bacterium]
MAETGTNLISSINKSGSGVDLGNLVEGLVAAETTVKQSAITKKVEAANLQISSFGQLKTKLTSFSSSLTTLENTNARTTTSANTAATLTVTNEALAKDINANINVISVAKGQVVTFDLTDASLLASSSLSAASTIPQGDLTLTLAGVNTVITIDGTNDTVQGLINEINEISGMQASFVDATGSGGLALILKSDTGTANAFSLAGSGGLSAFSTSGMTANSSPITLSVAATNAVFEVDGLTVTRSANSITDVFEGYNLDINAVSNGAFKIASTVLSTNARDRMQSFVDNINEVKNYLLTETKRGRDGAEDGTLVGDVTATKILREIRALTTREIVGFSSQSYYLANLGVQTERDGKLTLNITKFDAALAANPDLLNVVFASKYSTDKDNLKVTGSANFPPVAGSYSFSFSSGASTGTLNGETITPKSNSAGNKVFTGSSGNAKNLSVELLSDLTTSATVRFGQSLTDKLQKYISDINSASGAINVRTRAINQNLSDYSDEQSDLDARIEALTAAYNEKFGAMEALVTQLNKTGEYLTSLMDAWNKKD